MLWFNSRIGLLKPYGYGLRILVGKWEVCCGSLACSHQRKQSRFGEIITSWITMMADNCSDLEVLEVSG